MSQIIIKAVTGGTQITVDNTKTRPFTLGADLFFKKDNYTSNYPGEQTYTVVDKVGARAFNPELLSNITLISLDGTQTVPTSEDQALSILKDFEGFKKGGSGGGPGTDQNLQSVLDEGNTANKGFVLENFTANPDTTSTNTTDSSGTDLSNTVSSVIGGETIEHDGKASFHTGSIEVSESTTIDGTQTKDNKIVLSTSGNSLLSVSSLDGNFEITPNGFRIHAANGQFFDFDLTNGPLSTEEVKTLWKVYLGVDLEGLSYKKYVDKALPYPQILLEAKTYADIFEIINYDSSILTITGRFVRKPDGIVQINSQFNSSEYIPINGAKIELTDIIDSSGATSVAFYNGTTFISSAPGSNANGDITTISVPINATQFRLCAANSGYTFSAKVYKAFTLPENSVAFTDENNVVQKVITPGGSSATPTLNQVLLTGNTSDQNIVLDDGSGNITIFKYSGIEHTGNSGTSSFNIDGAGAIFEDSGIIASLLNGILNINNSGKQVTLTPDELSLASGNFKINAGAGTESVSMSDPVKEQMQNILAVPTSSEWQTPTLNTGFVENGADRPQYRRIGSRVYLRGSVIGDGTTTTPMFSVDEGYKPLKQYSLGGNTTLGIKVVPGGEVSRLDLSQTSIRLDGLSYDLD